MLFGASQRRSPSAAGGADGWGTKEMQALPREAWQPVEDLFNSIEGGLGVAGSPFLSGSPVYRQARCRSHLSHLASPLVAFQCLYERLVGC